jgi:1,4-alpha-glucan branching enzyme
MIPGREAPMKLLPVSTGRIVRFELDAEPGSHVAVAGTFNNWDPKANRLRDTPDGGTYRTALHLPSGTHEYKFVVNGDWTHDPKCPDCVPDGYGSLNSVLLV